MKDRKPEFELQSAPRPRARLTDDEIRSVTMAAAGKSFDRPLRAALAASLPVSPGPVENKPRTLPAANAFSGRSPQSHAGPHARGDDDALLKLKIPAELATSLKYEAIRRKVTLRFLVLEALATAGYAFNFTEIPEDGRRLR